MDEDEDLTLRVGVFFLLIGSFLAVLFIASDMAGQTDFDYLFLAMLTLGAGWMMRRGKKRPPPSNRFAWFKKTREAMKNRGGRQDDKKPQEKKN
jgi:hypothetical protein